MKLKCIGGKCDGQSMWIDQASNRLNDKVSVPEKITITCDVFDPDTMDDIINSYMQIYQIDCLKYSNGPNRKPNEIWFLKPENLTTWDAIQFQFLK